MPIVSGQERIVIKRSNVVGQVPTIPTSEDFTVGNTFLVTDILIGEFFANIADDRLWLRTQNGIIEVTTSAPYTELWERIGDDIVATPSVSSPIVQPDILPAVNAVSDLGNATYNWRKLFIDDSIIFADETTIGYRTGSVGTASVVLGGTNGIGNTSSGTSTFVTGDNSIASGAYAMCLGQDSVASGDHSFSTGNTCIASGNKSNATGGHATANHYGEQARSSFFFAGQADAQHGSVQYGYKTTGNTITELFLDGIAGTARFTLPQNTVYAIELRGLAVDNATGDSAMWTAKGIIKNVAGTTSLVAAIIPTQDAADTSMLATVLTVTANNGNSSLKIQGTGLAATNILWNITVNYTKIAI